MPTNNAEYQREYMRQRRLEEKRQENLQVFKSAIESRKTQADPYERFQKIKRIVSDLYAIRSAAETESVFKTSYSDCMVHLKETGKFPFWAAREACKSRFAEETVLTLPDAVIAWEKNEEDLTRDFEDIIRLDRQAIYDYSREAETFKGWINQLLEKGYSDTEITTAIKPHADNSEALLYVGKNWFSEYLPVFRDTYETLKKKREEHEFAMEQREWFTVEHPEKAAPLKEEVIDVLVKDGKLIIIPVISESKEPFFKQTDKPTAKIQPKEIKE